MWNQHFTPKRAARMNFFLLTPLMAFKVVENETQSHCNNGTPILTKWLSVAFQFCTLNTALTSDLVPDTIRQILTILGEESR